MELLNSIIDHVNNEQLQLAARSSPIGRSRKSSRRMVDIMDFQEKMHKNEVKNKSNPTIRLFRWNPPESIVNNKEEIKMCNAKTDITGTIDQSVVLKIGFITKEG